MLEQPVLGRHDHHRAHKQHRAHNQHRAHRQREAHNQHNCGRAIIGFACDRPIQQATDHEPEGFCYLDARFQEIQQASIRITQRWQPEEQAARTARTTERAARRASCMNRERQNGSDRGTIGVLRAGTGDNSAGLMHHHLHHRDRTTQTRRDSRRSAGEERDGRRSGSHAPSRSGPSRR